MTDLKSSMHLIIISVLRPSVLRSTRIVQLFQKKSVHISYSKRKELHTAHLMTAWNGCTVITLVMYAKSAPGCREKNVPFAGPVGMPVPTTKKKNALACRSRLMSATAVTSVMSAPSKSIYIMPYLHKKSIKTSSANRVQESTLPKKNGPGSTPSSVPC